MPFSVFWQLHGNSGGDGNVKNEMLPMTHRQHIQINKSREAASRMNWDLQTMLLLLWQVVHCRNCKKQFFFDLKNALNIF